MSDVIILKVQAIQRCVRRAREEQAAAGAAFRRDFSRQDAALLNVLRACEQAIDLANHMVRLRQLGVPGSSHEAFALLAQAGVVPEALARRLAAMVGFRNVAVHQYRELNLDIVEAVLGAGLDDLLALAESVVSALRPQR